MVRLEKAWPAKVAERTVWWCIVEANSQGVSRRYQLPMVLLKELETGQVIATLNGAEQGYVVDAWTWPPFAEWILQAMGGEEKPAHLASWHEGSLRTDLKATPILKEQSNTALSLEGTYFLKAIRALAPGIQPEEEMGRELTARSFAHTIPMLGGLALTTQPESTSLAVLSKFTASLGSGWEWLLASVKAPPNNSAEAQWGHIPSNSDLLLESAHSLGQRTAELHRCLAQPSDDPAFAPEPFGQSDYDALCARILERYEVLRHLTQLHNGSPIRELFKREDILLAITRQPFNPTTLKRHRIHGDYHLGQVLRTENDWLIIDFEGEPLRPLSERRAKDLCLRDVAGMIRSFAYLSGITDSPFPNELRQAFMDGYVKVEPSISNPASNQLLLLYVLEKALYEIEYELATQRGHDWLLIPLAGAVILLEQWSKRHRE